MLSQGFPLPKDMATWGMGAKHEFPRNFSFRAVIFQPVGGRRLCKSNNPFTGVTYDHQETQMSTLQFITVANLQLQRNNKNNFTWVTTT